jgi:transcriptional regulator with XRE-family HTH domain
LGTTAVIKTAFMDFQKRLIALRQQRHLSQQELARAVGVHVTQMRRYEAGSSHPTLEVLRNLAKTLRVSADTLLFDTTERGPDAALRLQFEAITKLDADEKRVVKDVLDALLLKHDAKQWAR